MAASGNPWHKFIVTKCHEKGLKQRELEKIAGLSQGAIYHYKCGGKPSRASAEKLDKALELPPGTVESTIVREKMKYKVQHEMTKEEEKILAAWKRGDRTPEEVQEITGYSMQVIGKYLPLRMEA